GAGGGGADLLRARAAAACADRHTAHQRSVLASGAGRWKRRIECAGPVLPGRGRDAHAAQSEPESQLLRLGLDAAAALDAAGAGAIGAAAAPRGPPTLDQRIGPSSG